MPEKLVHKLPTASPTSRKGLRRAFEGIKAPKDLIDAHVAVTDAP